MKNITIRLYLRHKIGLLLCIAGMVLLLSFTKKSPLYIDSSEITLSLGNKVFVVETNNWMIRKELALKEVLDISYNKDGKYLALADCAKNSVVAVETDNYCEQTVLLSSDRCPEKLVYSPDNKHIAAAVVGRGLYILGDPQPVIVPDITGVTDLQYHPSGNRLAISTKNDFQVWKTSPLGLEVKKDRYAVNCLVYSPNGKQIFVGLNDGWAVLNAGGSYKEVYKFKGDAVKDIAIDPAGKWIGTITANSAVVYNAQTYQQARNFPFLTPVSLKDIEFSGNGMWLAIGEHHGTIHFYTVKDWTKVKTLHLDGNLKAMAFKPVNLIIPQKTTNIYIVRHAEKEAGDDPHLSREGVLRAKTLADTMRSKKINLVLTTHTNRTFETAKPTADVFGLSPRYYEYEPRNDTITPYLKKLWGKNILLVTHSDKITSLVQKFVPCTSFDSNAFDNLIIIRRTKGLNQTVSTKLIESKYGEPSNPN